MCGESNSLISFLNHTREAVLFGSNNHLFACMEAAASTPHHAYGLGPRGPNPSHGAQQAQGPHQATQGPFGAPRAEEQHQQPQQHHKPFFYIQPAQPYLPVQSLQWPVPLPMPVSYNPYCGYPGLGYGMPVMPHYQPSPYVEPPGYVMPHTHLHLMDYRRMLNPHYYQTMAYHARRFRYQHNAPPREMISSEVQTEPLRSNPAASAEDEASNSRTVCNDPDETTSLSTALAVQRVDRRSVDHRDAALSSTTRAPPKSSFVIQTEELRIECCTTPVGLQVLRSHETAELARAFSQDVAQCSSIHEGGLGLCLPADQPEQSRKTCPDILLVGTPSEKIPAVEESRNQMEPVGVASDVGSGVVAQSDAQATRCETDQTVSRSSKGVHFKVLHLPFDLKYPDELSQMESTVWSLEDTCFPTSEWLMENSLMETRMQALTPVAEATQADAVAVRGEVPAVEISMTEDVLTVESPVVELASEADICLATEAPVTEEAPVSDLTPIAEVTLTPVSLFPGNCSPMADVNQQRGRVNYQDHQETSFESLPAYLPSTSWLADFENIYYHSKTPQTPQKQPKPLSSHGAEVPGRRRKLELEYKERPAVLNPKERCKKKAKVDRKSFSDHECFLNRNFSENVLTLCGSKGERLCNRCQAKRRIRISSSPGLDAQILKRKSVPFQPWNDTLLPTCEACKSHSNNKRLAARLSSSDVHRPYHEDDTEGETSENSSCQIGPNWRDPADAKKTFNPKRPLAPKHHTVKCPAALHPKLREKNCACNESQQQPVTWERLYQRPHGNANREMNEENCDVPVPLQDKCRNADQRYLPHRWQTEKSWKAAVSHPDTDSLKNGARSKHLNKHMKSQPQSQGTHRKDTRW
ncbi:uncharacterized protein LOC115378517 isoform X2 [Myripristis murdjan]|uniref:uncharacterized protein LOC115378517 isoform X2 n=1 Tax=Myripristis murdjan TaxID=586833 RepID=UPI0011762996|nr:uncharacterized protein LOC115378517 isoform X2 [Myripristis murdjan]